MKQGQISIFDLAQLSRHFENRDLTPTRRWTQNNMGDRVPGETLGRYRLQERPGSSFCASIHGWIRFDHAAGRSLLYGLDTKAARRFP
jgi:hypothetical protein